MSKRIPTPLQASFWITAEERRYLLVIITILVIGSIVRYVYFRKTVGEPLTSAAQELNQPVHECVQEVE